MGRSGQGNNEGMNDAEQQRLTSPMPVRPESEVTRTSNTSCVPSATYAGTRMDHARKWSDNSWKQDRSGGLQAGWERQPRKAIRKDPW